MPKNNQPVSAAQLERRHDARAKRQRWDQFWSIVTLAIIVGLFVFVVAIQISHHV